MWENIKENLEVAERKWFAMSRDQKMKHLEKASAAPMSNVQNLEAVAYSSDVGHPSLEDVSTSTVCNELMPVSSTLGLPTAVIERIARKNVEDLKTENGVVPTLGYGTAAHMVMSKSGKWPHNNGDTTKERKLGL